ncbi:unnamed protein product [Sympodiomycopsis kandeliae]
MATTSTTLAPPIHNNGSGTASSSSSLAAQQQQQQLGSTSNASGLRRSARNLKSVNELIGGRVQEIFVLDDDDDDHPDDEAPPSRPLAADLTNGHANHHDPHNPASQLARLNGMSTTASSSSSSAASRGKRKAQASPLQQQQPPPPQSSSISSTTAANLSQQLAASKKRRRDNQAQQQQQQQQPLPLQPQSGYPSSGEYYPSSSSTSHQHQQQQQQQQQSWAGDYTANYRGGYSGGQAVIPTANGVMPIPNSTSNLAYDYPSDSGSNVRKLVTNDGDPRKHRKLDHTQQQLQPPTPLTPTPAQQQKQQLPVADNEGHFIVREGDYISDPRGGDNRFKILSQLGQGTFGKVVECYDRLQRRYVAIKVIRAVQKYRDASQIEIRVLKTLSENDPHNENKCIHLLDTFSYRNHVCIVSELLGKSVFDFLKDNSFLAFPPTHIWSFAKSLLKSVAFLHNLNLVHTDLKPENILLVNSEYDWQMTSKRANARRKKVLKDTDIRLIDFGSATFNEEYHSQVVSTRHYRAPEIILNMGWSYPCDAWSIGCILIEFYTGDALFQTHDNLEHLAMMEQVLGPMPDSFRRKAETYKADYFRYGRLDFPNSETPKNSKKYVAGMKRLNDIVSKAVAWKKHNDRFLHLLKRLLEFDPSKRIKVADALCHPYFDLAPNEIPP